MTKIGITGSRGLLGSLLIKKLKIKKISYSTFNGDIRNNNDIREWIKKNSKIRYIFHFAAISSTKKAIRNKKKVYDVNVSGTLKLIKNLKKYEKKIWFFFPSSSHVYKYSKNKLNENSLLKPSSIYGRTKLNSEKTIIKNKSKNFNFFIGRIFSVYHKNQKKPFLYPSIKEKLKLNNGKVLRLKNGSSTRDFLNAEDVIDIIYKIYKKKLVGIYNIGSGQGMTIKSFVEKNFNLRKIILLDKNINTLVCNNKKLIKKLNEKKI